MIKLELNGKTNEDFCNPITESRSPQGGRLFLCPFFVSLKCYVCQKKMAQYKYKTPFDNEEVQRITRHKVGALLGDQIRVFDSTYISRSGKTRSGLFSMKSNARTSSGGFALEYPAAIQFLDLKYSTSSRSEKINHAFIFRRYVYGHILGSSKIGRKQTSLKRMLQISMNLSLQNILNPKKNEEK